MSIGPQGAARTGELAKFYASLFDTVRADTPALLEEVYRLRYQVYCVENQFLDAGRYEGDLEKDEFDAHSIHGLLIHRPTSALVGTVRLVMPRPGVMTGTLPMDFISDDVTARRAAAVPLATSGEISRFAISKSLRRRLGDGRYGGEVAGAEMAETRRVIPHASLGLMTLVVRFAAEHGIGHICAVMEPALLRLLARCGVHFDNLGPVVDFHGPRQPCYADLGRLLARTREEQPEVWRVLTDDGRLWPNEGPGNPARRDARTLAGAGAAP